MYEGAVRFIHAADVHLDSPLVGLGRYEGAPAHELRAATRRALENLVALSIEESASLLLVAGDLFDGGWKDYNTGLFFTKQMAKLHEADVKVAIISGNHDAESEITRSLRLPPNVYRFDTKKAETKIYETLGVALHGQGFATRKVTDDLAARYPDPIPGMLNVGLLHTALDGREGHDTYAPTTADKLARKGYDYWALGHVHAREIVREHPWIVFPGNLQGRNIRETGAKGASVVYVGQRGITKVEHRPLDVVRWALCEVDATGARAPSDVLDRIESALARAAQEAEGRLLAVRVRVIGACPAHVAMRGDLEHFENEVRALGLRARSVWVEKVLVHTQARAQDAGAGSEAARLLAEEIARLRGSDELAQILDRIREKLPAPVRRDGFDAAALLEDAEALLLARLYGVEDA